MAVATRKSPPLLPAKRARLVALQAAVREALAVPASRGFVFPGTVDTGEIDAGWPTVSGAPTPLDVLAAMVRARKTGRSFPAQAAARAAVVAFLERADVRDVRLGDVRFVLGTDQIVGAGEVRALRSAPLRVQFAKPARGTKAAAPHVVQKTGGVNLTRVREVLRAAATSPRTNSPVPRVWN